MTSNYRAVVIGCGVGGQGRAGVHSIGYLHGGAYRRSDRIELVAAADLVAENAANYAKEFGFERTYSDYRAMLKEERPDFVSVCTWPPLHADMVVAAAEAGAKAIWCEKPMALSMGDVDRMIDACERNGSKLVVNHQRRFLGPFQEVRKIIAAGGIGQVLTIHAGIEGWDLLSWGTHWIDMFRFFLGDQRCEWVVAQIDARGQQRKYGHRVEDHAFTCFAFEGGAHAFLETGRTIPNAPTMRIAGTEGIIDILEGDAAAKGTIRVLSGSTNGWEYPETSETTYDFATATDRLLAQLVAWVDGGPEPSVSARGGRATTEMIMACYESARRGAIIDLPVEAKDFPLETLAERASERALSAQQP